MQACVRRICQLYTKGGRAANSHDVNPLETIWIIVDETTYKDPAPKTLDELRLTTLHPEECVFGHALGARTFYISPLRKCQKTYKKTFWLLIF